MEKYLTGGLVVMVVVLMYMFFVLQRQLNLQFGMIQANHTIIEELDKTVSRHDLLLDTVKRRLK